MTLRAQLWGSANEKIHTLGTSCLGISLLAFLIATPLTKIEALFTFFWFGLGIALIGVAMLRNAWMRFRYGENTLILLKRRGTHHPIQRVRIHLFGQAICWEGRVAHVDAGVFRVEPLTPDTPPPEGSLAYRAYGLFRAAYWTACSTIWFQATFGLGALGYCLWLVAKLWQYKHSKA